MKKFAYMSAQDERLFRLALFIADYLLDKYPQLALDMSSNN